MASRSDPVASSTARRASQRDGTGGSGRAARGNVICVVCQRPVDETTDRTWRGEPVHFECGAELRCGVSLGDPNEG